MQGYVLAVDIGGTNVRMGLVSEDGDVVYEETSATRDFIQFDLFVYRLEKVIHWVKSETSGKGGLLGVGIAVPSVSRTGVVRAAANLQWGEVPLAEQVEEKLNLPVLVVNDANAAAIGEYRYGIARGLKNFALVTVGTGLGCGLVLDGDLVLGHNGFAGEFGHTQAVPNGRLCGCGRRGCLESYVSASGICRTVNELLALERRSTPLADYASNQLTSEMIWRHAQQGDELARNVYQYTGRILGSSLADLAALIDPELIVLFGGVLKAGELLLEPTRKAFQENLLAFHKDAIQIVESSIPNDRAPLLGVNALIRESRVAGRKRSVSR